MTETVLWAAFIVLAALVAAAVLARFVARIGRRGTHRRHDD